MNEMDDLKDDADIISAEVKIIKILLKRFSLPQDVSSYLDLCEESVKALRPEVSNIFEKEFKVPILFKGQVVIPTEMQPSDKNELLKSIKDARYQYERGNTNKLKRIIYGLIKNMEVAADQLAHHDKDRYKIEKRDEMLKTNSDKQAMWRDKAEVLQKFMAELRSANPTKSYT